MFVTLNAIYKGYMWMLFNGPCERDWQIYTTCTIPLLNSNPVVPVEMYAWAHTHHTLSLCPLKEIRQRSISLVLDITLGDPPGWTEIALM